MDLLASYDSDSDASEHSQQLQSADGGVTLPGGGVAAQHRQVEPADVDDAPQSKKARLSSRTDSCKVLGAAAATAAAAEQSAGSELATLPPEPERVRCFPLVEGLFPTVVYVPVPKAAAQQLHALACALVAACAAADLQPQCGSQSTAGSSSSSSSSNSSSKVLLWPTCPPAEGSSSSTHSSAVPEPHAPPPPPQQQQQDSAQAAPPAAALPLHLSLSQTVPIRFGQAASLRAALEKQLRPCRKFKLQLSGLVCLTNEPKTRTFVCIRAAAGLQQVLRMIAQVDAAFKLHGLPLFHEDPIPHVSLAWTPGDQTQVLQQWLDSFQHGPVAFAVSHVQCQVGKLKHTVWEA